MLRENATGFFHVGKTNGIWWIVDPRGNMFICKGVNHVNYEGDHAPSLGYSPYNKTVSKKYGSSENWSKVAVERIRSFGFNTIGAWSSDDAFAKGMSYTVILDIASTAGSEWQSGKVIDFFSSKFENVAHAIAERLCLPRKDDPYLLGYFTDNELRWSPDWRSTKYLLDDYLSLPPEAEGKRALVGYLKGKYLEIGAFNKAWNTSFCSFDEILNVYALPKGNVLESDALGFLEIVSKKYFQVCHDAIWKYDPNHIILGCRYAFKPPDEALKGCIGYIDVISINNYGDEPQLKELRTINALTGLPIMITEFSFKAMDSGLPNMKGAGVPLNTQEERADHYEIYVRKLISEPYVVGYHWFEYTDEPIEGRFDGENSNYGLVDIEDEPWMVLVSRTTAINLQAEILHLQAGNNAVTFYVSPNGDDRWSGGLPSPSPNKTDGPFATISRARDAIRQLKTSKGNLERPVIVLIRGGIYFLSEPLPFTADDSGTDSCQVLYISYPGETPVISGGRLITGWRQVIVGGKQMWAADIPEARDGKWPFHELWIDGHRRLRARHPNKGYLRIADLPDVTSQTQWTEGQRRFKFYEGELVAWSTATEAEVIVMNRWVESRLPIVSIDEAEHLVTFNISSAFRLDPGDLYYVENALELLGSPGEWYLDRKAGTLYYIPMPGENMSEVEVIAPILSQLLRLEGNLGDGRPVHHVIFRGLTFAHTEFSLPSDRSSFGQAAIVAPASFYGEGTSRCAIEFCNFIHLGTYAIELSRGCNNNTIVGCELSDLGAGGIKIGEKVVRNEERDQTHDNEVSDCHIYDGGLVYHSAVGIWIGQSYSNAIKHNHIHDFYYTGISVGWTWGYGPSLARSNVVEFNEINNIGVRSNGDGPILSDMGGIYTLGARPSTIIRFNIFYDIAGFRYGGWGIYFDEGSTQVIAEDNVVYRTTHGGFHQHYGRENVVRNNIFAFGRDTQIQRTRLESHLSFTFERNIVYWRYGDLFTGDDSNLSFDYNLYWREGDGKILFGKFSFNEWHERGMDIHSIIADPLFVDPDIIKLTLNDNSPAFSLGFRPIDLSKIGPRISIFG